MNHNAHGYDYDVAVLGAGSSGFAAARTTGAAGLKTIILEGGREVGGLCILRGCMPTKALLYAAEVRHLVQTAPLWGIRPGGAGFNFAEVMARKDRVISGFADYRREQLAKGPFEFRRANARFLDAHTLVLDSGEKLTAANFVICTGSRVAPSPLPKLDAISYLTSDTALELNRLPASMIVLGGGAVALEFGQFFARFGVKVALIQRSPHVLHDFDGDAAATIERVLRNEGMNVYTGTQLLDAWASGDEKEIAFLHGADRVQVRAEEVLYALGRRPNTEHLDLEKAGVSTLRGRVVTDPSMRTSVPHIYAAGDCTGPFEIVHLAVLQGQAAGHNIAHPDRARRMDYRLAMEVIFTDPQLACVGLTEARAKRENVPYLVASYPFSDHGKSIIMEAVHGFVKLLADPRSGEILGACCAGPSGGELLHEIVAAMSKHMTVHELADMPHYHPTLAEIWTYPAEELAERIQVSR